ncbi:MAG: hypothetical protein EOP92_06385 [Lysobacteraceae bacterium]|nr:MAG: hypothetical protein EOP92_06385 [Xanthomonadaceae bacterium]
MLDKISERPAKSFYNLDRYYQPGLDMQVEFGKSATTDALAFISDKNLISARHYGIELDIEDSCTLLAATVVGAGMASPRPCPQDPELQRLAGMFREILLHLWPEPGDPAVVNLRMSARLALDHIASLRASAVQ